jgi:hypothetical protein
MFRSHLKVDKGQDLVEVSIDEEAKKKLKHTTKQERDKMIW